MLKLQHYGTLQLYYYVQRFCIGDPGSAIENYRVIMFSGSCSIWQAVCGAVWWL